MKKYVNKGLKFIKLSYRCNIINSKIWVKNIIYKKIQIFNKNKSFKIKNIKKFFVNKRLKIKVIQIKTLMKFQIYCQSLSQSKFFYKKTAKN